MQVAVTIPSPVVVHPLPPVIVRLPGPATLLVEHAGSSACDRVSESSEGVDWVSWGRPFIYVPDGDAATTYYSEGRLRWVVLSVGGDPDQRSLDRWGEDGGAPCAHPRCTDGHCDLCGDVGP